LDRAQGVKDGSPAGDLSERAPPARRRSFLRRHAAKLTLSLAVACGLVYSIQRGGLKLIPKGADFQTVRWWILPIYAAAFVTLTWFRSTRWRFLLGAGTGLTKRRLFAISIVGFTAILLLPFRIGELVRPYLARTPAAEAARGPRRITMAMATSSIMAERVIDGLYLSLVLAASLVLVPTIHPLPEKVVGLPITVGQVRGYAYSILGLFSCLFVGVAAFYWMRSWAHALTLKLVGLVSRPIAEKVAGTFEQLADGLHVFGSRTRAVGFLFETTIYWGLSALGLGLLAWGSGVVHADGSVGNFGEACALLGMLGCAVMLPGPPGLLGVFQAGLYAGMVMYYPTVVVTGPGASFVFLTYAMQVVCQLAMTVWAISAVGIDVGRTALDALD
jgi:hypothetical protein